MGGCSAINCSNHSRNKFRMFRFPADEARRRKWTINCRRDGDGWVPGSRPELCSVHFEESQFEQHRADNVKKLKPNAIPTLFDVPNPPETFASKRVKGRGLPKSGSILDKTSVDDEEGKRNCFDVEKNSDVEDTEKTRKKRKVDSPSPPQTTMDMPEVLSAQNNFDREDIFGQYVASELRALRDNPLLYLQTKQSILEILTSANLEYLNPE